MLPEMAAEGRVVLFRSSSFPDEWQEDAVLLDDVSAYDPTIVFRDGRYWLFYASGTTGYSFNDELQLAFSDSLRGPYTPHPWNPVKSDVIGSRPAGRLFEWNGRLIRPAQDSSREYGYAVVFNEVTALTPTTFSEQPIGRLEPDWAPRIRSTHSWDFLDDIVVADAKRLHPKHPTGRLTRFRGGLAGGCQLRHEPGEPAHLVGAARQLADVPASPHALLDAVGSRRRLELRRRSLRRRPAPS